MECKKVAALVLAGAMAVTTMAGCGRAGGVEKDYHSESSRWWN